MSTRGCVAIGTPNKWRGVYNKFDSYPDKLGFQVWSIWKENSNLPNDLLKFDDWRAYLNGGFCQYCGKKTTQPHDIKVNKYTQTKFCDPDCLYHRHWPAEKIKELQLTSDKPNPLFVEWVYVMDVDNRLFHVLSSISDPNYRKDGYRHILNKNGFIDYGHCAYKHIVVGSYSIDENRFDSNRIMEDSIKAKMNIDPGYKNVLEEFYANQV